MTLGEELRRKHESCPLLAINEALETATEIAEQEHARPSTSRICGEHQQMSFDQNAVSSGFRVVGVKSLAYGKVLLGAITIVSFATGH
jgi:hypothetical protein